MKDRPLLSLCIPTNGIIDWVIPTIDNIYKQKVDNSLFEIIITDNGNNREFKKIISRYAKAHSNLYYYENNSGIFLNEIESYRKASGVFIKYVNHRNILHDGVVNKLIDFVQNNLEEKPIVYFSNGVLQGVGNIDSYDNFNDFVKRLSYFSSWSSGMAIWKDDLDKLPELLDCYNELFPHTTILFNERKRKRYIVDNSVIFHEIDTGNKPKGKYDVFYAFGIEYPSIIYNLLKDGDITKETFEYVKQQNLGFIGRLYINFVVLKKFTSYDLSGFNDMFGKFYTKKELYIAIIKKSFWKAKKEIRKKLGLKV